MDAEKLCKLAKEYPEVAQLLKDNFSLSVAVLRGQLEKVERRLGVFDANHCAAQAKIADRVSELERRVDAAAEYTRELKRQIRQLEGRPVLPSVQGGSTDQSTGGSATDAVR